MGIADSFKDMAGKAKDKLGEDKIDQGIENVGDQIDERTGNKHSDKVDKGQDFLRDQFGSRSEDDAPQQQ